MNTMKPSLLLTLIGSLFPAVLCLAQDAGIGESDWETRREARRSRSTLYRMPAMMGDFWRGSPLRFRADETRDRLVVRADDLDSPSPLPSSGSTLTISEAGPVGVFSTSLQSVQQLQTMLRTGSPVPGATLVGTVNSPATLTTANTISQIQQQLASTPQGYDIILLQSPPGAYATTVEALLVARNGNSGVTQFNAAASGALLQGGTDTLTGAEDFDAYYFYDYIVRIDAALTDAASGGVGRMKIADGGTVLPQDRVFLRYNYVDAVRYSDSGVGLNRFVPGFERSFANGLASIELRAPIAATTVSSYSYDGFGVGSDRSSRFGNLTLYGKTLLVQREALAISGGLGVALPTASDTRMNLADGTPLMQISNQSVDLLPFLAGIYMPNQDWFVQTFLQCDVAANGNRVSMNQSGAGLETVGILTDRSNLYFDTGVGYWLYRTNAVQGLTGVIPMLELHHSTALGNSDQVNAGRFIVGDFTGAYSQTSVTAGTTFEFAQRANLTCGYSTPLGNGSDNSYSGAFQLFLSAAH